MEKQKADELITRYLEKIYGFAFKKAYSHDEAEELAAEMTAKVYHSLLSSDTVYNPDGYVWRICENTYARYVAMVKSREGVSIDVMPDIPGPVVPDPEDESEERNTLRREIAFLSALRREIVFAYYYKNESIRKIAARLQISEGTVKWHLNRSRKELKEGLSMERPIGNLGLSPVTASCLGHSGWVGKNGGPEHYLSDRLSLNIVYSVYFKPRSVKEIAEELGMTPVFIEDKAALLEKNGFLVRQKGDRYTTYVKISPRTYSKEQIDTANRIRADIAERLIREYVPAVRKSIENIKDIYIPGGNRELFEAAVIFYAVQNKCVLNIRETGDYDKYIIQPTDGGRFAALVQLQQECIDPDYVMTVQGDYFFCGNMWRQSGKYPVSSWSVDSHLDAREGCWENNVIGDYEYIYELLTGKISDGPEDAEKLARLKERRFTDDQGKIMIMMVKGESKDLFDLVPELDPGMKEEFTKAALDCMNQEAKNYPPQMQDMIMRNAREFIDGKVAIMIQDKLYGSGALKPLTDGERITANLIMFSDVLPELI